MSLEEEAHPGQAEYNFGAAMDSAVEAAARSAEGGGGPAPDAATLAAARERAGQLLEGEDAAGLRDMHNLTLAFGLPATRLVFRHMLAAKRVRGAAKRAALQEISEFSPITEVGCMKVDFYNVEAQRPEVAYLLLDQCPRAHDLGAQLDKIKPLVSPAKWPEVLRHLSALVFYGRSVYAKIAGDHLPLIRMIFGLDPADACDQFLALRVDPQNTTLFLDEAWPHRVGIYVRLESELAK